jgi:hypothetical protein
LSTYQPKELIKQFSQKKEVVICEKSGVFKSKSNLRKMKKTYISAIKSGFNIKIISCQNDKMQAQMIKAYVDQTFDKYDTDKSGTLD